MTNKPMLSVELQLTEQQERDLTRFYDTCEDSQSYDVPKDRMKSLACVGLVRSLGFSRYELTDAGGAAVEKLRALLDKQDDVLPCDVKVAPGTIIRKGCKVSALMACVGARYGLDDKFTQLIEPAAQPQGEPIYQVMYRGDGGGGWCDAEKDSYDMKVPHPKHWRTRIVYAEKPAPVAVVMPFAEKVIGKLQRFYECAEDGQDVDIGRHWFDTLTQLGLLNRVQRSPAIWEITEQGEEVLEASKLNGVKPVEPSENNA